MMKRRTETRRRQQAGLGRRMAIGFLAALLLGTAAGSALAADVILNGDFPTNISNWTPGGVGAGTVVHDGAIGGGGVGSGSIVVNTGRNLSWIGQLDQSITTTINAADTVNLSFWWYKAAVARDAGKCDIYCEILKPGGSIPVEIWSDVGNDPLADSSIQGTYPTTDVSSFFDVNGTYTITFRADMKNGNNTAASTQANFDDIVLDVQGAANSPPAVTTGATAVSPASVDRAGANTTTISTTFTDADAPGVGAFTATFKVREPDNSTEVILVNAQTNGNGGLTITDGGGGSYTASYTWDPGAAQATGTYDLYFEVSDGPDNAIDGYSNNGEELTVTANAVPTVAASATAVSPPTVNRIGANTTTVSTTFTDADLPGVGAFTVTFKVREPDNSTEVTLVNAQTNGGAGLTITDGGGGTYTASYTWDPGAGQTTGDYDLYFEVSDGADTAIDDYTANPNELNVFSQTAPSVVPSATGVSPALVNRIGANTTAISTTFTDVDQPGVGAFTVSFKVREPDNSTEVVLVNAQTNGGGGLTITDGGGGSYTASYAWDPGVAQTIGDYDLYFEVSDGPGTASDDYAVNSNELNVFSNTAPSVVANATGVSPTSVNRIGGDTTTISTTFTDTDQPGIGAFTVTFKVREPDNSTEAVLVNAQTNGGGGLTISDGGGGNYTANYTWDPGNAQAIGAYDLYFEVSDGGLSATDDYTANPDELTLTSNYAPTVAAGITITTPTWVVRTGANTSTLSTTFTDLDDPGVGAFTVTFKVREPDNATEVVLVNAQPNGGGGLTITANGGGSYTAAYDWDPPNGQTLGLHDLYFDVGDGTASAVDGYAANLDEVDVVTSPPNNVPVVAVGATGVSPSSVDRDGTNTTTISTIFTDADAPGVGAFTVTFKAREPDNSTEVVLVNAQTDGIGGLSITDGGGGSYTASYTWDPGGAQTTGGYDLHFEVNDGTDAAIDGYVDNADELTVTGNTAPSFVASATGVSPGVVNRAGANPTTISATFTDIDQPGVGAFTVTFKVREPDNSTEVVLVNAQTNGNGGLSITDGGGGIYTASYVYDPLDAQTLGLYDLFFEVTDGIAGTLVDAYTDNLDELEINEVVNAPPTITPAATMVSVSPVDRLGASTTTISTAFTDTDDPGLGAFTVTFKIREPDNSTEVILVNAQSDGGGGLIIVDGGGGNYTASYNYDPAGTQALGLYDLYCEVSDGTDNAVDGYTDNLDELEIIEVPINTPPALVDSFTVAFPTSVDRFGSAATELSAPFSDADSPGISAFFVTFKVREPFNAGQITITDALQNGQSGLSISDDGGGNYTARIDWNPDDNATLGYYDLYCEVSDGTDSAVDGYDSNPEGLLLTSGGENNPPVIPGDATWASPAGVDRIGANPTTLSATFTDADAPGIGAFTVTFKVRHPDNSTETSLATDVGNGGGGVTITDDGGGIYTASVSWDPPDGQTLGSYDLYFHVSDGAATAIDDYAANLDELEIYDLISNSPPTIVAGATFVLPTTITRLGTEYTMLQSVFTDTDTPGKGAFTVTFRVRAPSAAETIIVNGAGDGEQGLRIRHLTGSDYEASVLWDPPVGQVTGTYDLQFEVQDNAAASAADTYANNADELTITATAVAGDGNLLRRNNDADGCGGPNSACHNMADHQSQDCRVCHTPHSTSNIYVVRETIQTPNSGPKAVVFKTLGIGDPYNDPDPTAGDANSGVLADDTDGVFTNLCEVCHTSTGHHRNDGSHAPPAHHNAEDCTSCHPHTEGFAVSGGGESSGGANCTCHASTFNAMNSSTSSYHHQLSSDAADYTISSKTCLTCHVDHDIFRPDLNVGFGNRSKNLRADITTPVVQGSAAVLSNSDYSSSGTGGICLSCHTSAQTKGYVQPDGTTQTPVISKTDFDAGTTAHNYTAPSTFGTDGSTFNANCVKCHNDNRTKSYQNSTDKFGPHDSDYRRILAPMDEASPTDPLEENFCFQCHSTTSNPNAGSNLDNYGVKGMTSAALGIETAFGRTYAHPTGTFSGRHQPIEDGTDLADGATRHAECADCHNPHAAQQGIHDGSSNLVSNALKGAWGVEPTWPARPTPGNVNAFATPASYTKLEPAQKEYQICLKCHSNYTTLPSGARNLAEEINPNYESTHGIVQAGTNPFCNTTTMNEPWGSSKIAYCSDCHRSSTAGDPAGPHGSNMEHLLVATVASDDAIGTPLCYVCHSAGVYWDTDSAASNYPKHPSTQGAHKFPNGCFSCHMWEFSTDTGQGMNSTDDLAGGFGKIFVHGMNKRFVNNEQDGSAGTGQYSDAFVDGYLENIDFTGRACWAETCKSHSNKSY